MRNKGAEVCEKYLKKGDKVYIEGRIKTRKWQDDKGMDRYSTEIQCTDFTFLTPKDQQGGPVQQPSQSQNQSNNTQQQSQPAQQASQPQVSQSSSVDEDDDLPF